MQEHWIQLITNIRNRTVIVMAIVGTAVVPANSGDMARYVPSQLSFLDFYALASVGVCAGVLSTCRTG